MLKTLVSGIDKISSWIGKTSSYLMLLVTPIICYEVAMRYVFHRPTLWASEAIVYLCGFVYVLGAAWTLQENRHVKIDLIYEKLSPRGKRIMDIFSFFFFALYMGMMLWVGTRFAIESFDVLETSGTPWDPPVYPVKIAFVIGVLLLILQGSAKLIRDIYFIIKGQEI